MCIFYGIYCINRSCYLTYRGKFLSKQWQSMIQTLHFRKTEAMSSVARHCPGVSWPWLVTSLPLSAVGLTMGSPRTPGCPWLPQSHRYATRGSRISTASYGTPHTTSQPSAGKHQVAEASVYGDDRDPQPWNIEWQTHQYEMTKNSVNAAVANNLGLFAICI